MSDITTRAVHAGREDLRALGVHVPPIDLSSTYPIEDVAGGGAAYDRLASGRRPDAAATLVYQRLWNPTVDRFERALADLEGADEAVAYASGMAALSATLLATVAAGRPHVVGIRPLYGGTDHVLANGLLGTSVTWASAETVATAITPQTGLVVLETPANPTLDLVDIAAVVAQAGDVPVLVDNTFATPILQNPIAQGATLVLHSATKSLGGHGDLLGGIVATTSEWATRLRQVRALTGAILYPMAAYEFHRGLQTLPVRVRAAQAGRAAGRGLAERPPGGRARPLPGARRSERARRPAAARPRSDDGVRGARRFRGGGHGRRVVRPNHARGLPRRRGLPHPAPGRPDPPHRHR